MITVTLLKQAGTCRKLISSGHAGYDDSGYDIVCAAVSALLINTANSLEQLTEEDIVIEEGGSGGGYLMIEFRQAPSWQGKLLMDSLMLGLESISQTYGDDFLTITEQEDEIR